MVTALIVLVRAKNAVLTDAGTVAENAPKD
jgi:hypothetical protein